MFLTFKCISREKNIINALISPSRCISTANYVCFNKEGKVMLKFLHKGSKKRSSWRPFDEKPILPQPLSLTKGAQSQKRVVVLNKLFMKHITDLMSTGATASKISGMGIEVTKVRVGSEYNIVNVHWISHGNCPENEVAEVLKKTAREVRQELCNLRVVGKVPEIQFIRDRSVSAWASVEAALAVADFGEDYVPRGVTNLKNDFGNEGLLSTPTGQPQPIEEDLPPMRQNVLGLNRADIMNRLIATMKGKSSATSNIKNDATAHLQLEPFDHEAFGQFLLKRKIMKDKMAKEGRRESPLFEAEEYEVHHETTFEEEDYIEEDDDSGKTLDNK